MWQREWSYLYGCGFNLNCVYKDPFYSQCIENDILRGALGKYCPSTGCPGGSYCKQEWGNSCAPCRTLYTTCGPSVFNAQSGDATECCPGRSCREVEAYVNGGIGMKSVCVSSTATKRDNYGLGFPSLERDAEPRPALALKSGLALNGTADERDHHLEKRVVVAFCYSKCQASSFTKTI